MTDNNKIVCAIDDSENAQNAFTWYIENLHREGNELVLVHSVEPIQMIGEVPSVQAYESLLDQSRLKAKQLEEKYEKLMAHYKISGKIMAKFASSPGQIVVDVAQEVQAKLIVCGCRGLGRFRRTILGSVSDYILHHAHCPVIVCRH